MLRSFLSRFPYEVYRELCAHIKKPQWIGLWPHNIYAPMNYCTSTYSCDLKGITINEKDDIDTFVPDEKVVMICSNYGEHLFPGFVKKEKKKSTKGRRAQPKKTKRKVQGNGGHFCSQITFVIRGNVQYKIKLFRTGKVQIPGCPSPDFAEVKKDILPYFIKYLEDNIEKKRGKRPSITITNEAPNIINGKSLLLNPVISIDTIQCGKVIQSMMSISSIPIQDVCYETTDDCNKVVVKFHTPISDDPNKRTTLQIFRKRIGIIGSKSATTSENIFRWLHDVIRKNYAYFMNDPLVKKQPFVDAKPNIDDEDDEEQHALIEEMNKAIPNFALCDDCLMSDINELM